MNPRQYDEMREKLENLIGQTVGASFDNMFSHELDGKHVEKVGSLECWFVEIDEADLPELVEKLSQFEAQHQVQIRNLNHNGEKLGFDLLYLDNKRPSMEKVTTGYEGW